MVSLTEKSGRDEPWLAWMKEREREEKKGRYSLEELCCETENGGMGRGLWGKLEFIGENNPVRGEAVDIKREGITYRVKFLSQRVGLI